MVLQLQSALVAFVGNNVCGYTNVSFPVELLNPRVVGSIFAVILPSAGHSTPYLYTHTLSAIPFYPALTYYAVNPAKIPKCALEA